MTIGPLLGIDHGLVRIGVAVSDPLGITARELTIIQRRSKREDFARLNHIAQQHAVVAIIVGMPHNDAHPGVHTQADTVRLWIERYQATTTLPILSWDEQLSSLDAQAISRHLRRPPRQPIDDLAARVILQSYLDALNDGLAPLPLRPTSHD